MSAVRLAGPSEPRQCHGLALVRPNIRFECVCSPSRLRSQGSIENDPLATRDFSISLDRVNWLGNITAVMYIPAAALTPWLISRYGVRRAVRRTWPLLPFSAILTIALHQCDLGALCLLIAAWVRYAGTASSLTSHRAYALLIFGQVRPTVSPHINRESSRDSQVLRKHSASSFPGSSGKVQRTMVQHAGKDDCNYGHGHHEPNRFRSGTTDLTVDKQPKAICENLRPVFDLPGVLILPLDLGARHHRDRGSSGCIPYLEPTSNSSKYAHCAQTP